MRSVLLPIDPLDPARTRAAVAEAVRIYRDEPVVVRLLRVLPRLNGHVAMLFGRTELHRLQEQSGLEDLAGAIALLDAAGVPCQATVLVGRGAETIARAARDFGCDRIVLGDDAPSLGGRIFGSLAQQVRPLLAAGEVRVIGS